MHQESPPGNDSNRPLFLMDNFCQPRVLCSLIFKKWRGFCCVRIGRFGFPWTQNVLLPPVPTHSPGRPSPFLSTWPSSMGCYGCFSSPPAYAPQTTPAPRGCPTATAPCCWSTTPRASRSTRAPAAPGRSTGRRRCSTCSSGSASGAMPPQPRCPLPRSLAPPPPLSRALPASLSGQLLAPSPATALLLFSDDFRLRKLSLI